MLPLLLPPFLNCHPPALFLVNSHQKSKLTIFISPKSKSDKNSPLQSAVIVDNGINGIGAKKKTVVKFVVTAKAAAIAAAAAAAAAMQQ